MKEASQPSTEQITTTPLSTFDSESSGTAELTRLDSEQPLKKEQVKMQTNVNAEKLNDIKVAFDSLRNMGICVAILLGLPTLTRITPYINEIVQIIFSFFVIGAVLGLAIANLIWTLKSFQEKSKRPWLHRAATSVMLVIASGVTLAFMVNAYFSAIGTSV